MLQAHGAWLDLINPSDAEHAQAASVAGFAVQSRADIAEIESSSRVSRVGDVLYLNSPVSYRDGDGLSAISGVGFALSATHLVTVRYAEMKAFDTFSAAYAKTGGCSAAAFAGLVEAMVDRLADVLEHMGADMDVLSRRTFRTAPRRSTRHATDSLRETLSRIGLCGETIDNLRDTLLGLARIVSYTQQTAAAWIPEEIKQRLAVVRSDIASLNDYDQQLTAKTSFLLDAVMGFINIEQNEVVRVLTVGSLLGIPPTFVVGLYGMNFKNIHEYDWAWGYEWGWAMIVVSVIVPLVWLRVKGWL
jgi:magnesium transporter